jgi:hypothetical protein
MPELPSILNINDIRAPFVKLPQAEGKHVWVNSKAVQTIHPMGGRNSQINFRFEGILQVAVDAQTLAEVFALAALLEGGVRHGNA